VIERFFSPREGLVQILVRLFVSAHISSQFFYSGLLQLSISKLFLIYDIDYTLSFDTKMILNILINRFYSYGDAHATRDATAAARGRRPGEVAPSRSPTA
jgi:hypothetical protein